MVNAELEDRESTDCEIKGTLVIRRGCGMDPGVTCILTVLIPVGIKGTRGAPLVRGVVGILPILTFLSGTRRVSSRLKKPSIVVDIVACIDVERALASTCNPDSSDGKVLRGGTAVAVLLLDVVCSTSCNLVSSMSRMLQVLASRTRIDFACHLIEEVEQQAEASVDVPYPPLQIVNSSLLSLFSLSLSSLCSLSQSCLFSLSPSLHSLLINSLSS